MKKTGAIIAVVLAVAIAAIWIVQSLNQKTVSKTISEDITAINVTLEGYDVSVRPSEDDDIHVTIKGSDEQYIAIDSDVLEINIPPSDKLVNLDLTGSTTLVIEIPENKLELIKIISEAGDIQIQEASAKEIIIHSENGSVSLIDVTGAVSAKTQIGEIKTSLPISKQTVSSNYGISNSLECTLGDEDTKQTLKITVTHGDIKIE